MLNSCLIVLLSSGWSEIALLTIEVWSVVPEVPLVTVSAISKIFVIAKVRAMVVLFEGSLVWFS